METIKAQKLVYLTRRKAEVLDLKEGLIQNNFDFFLVVGHRLKGHGETFGFPVISQFGVEMEEAAKNFNLEELARIVNSLDEIIEDFLVLVNKMK
jgi:HPt (histidine-containing phosphotransfer) domain-containing protein